MIWLIYPEVALSSEDTEINPVWFGLYPFSGKALDFGLKINPPQELSAANWTEFSWGCSLANW